MLRRIGAEEGGEFKAVASGTLPSGRPVIVNADGTVSVIGSSENTLGTQATVDASSNGAASDAAYDTANQKIVVVYRDNGNSNYGTAVVGTISGTTITFGSAVVFNSESISYPSAIYDDNAGKIVISYTTATGPNQGKSIVGTVSGTSISFGTAVNFGSHTDSVQYVNSSYDSNANRVFVGFRQSGDGNRYACVVGSVSGTSISFGSVTVIDSNTTSYNVSTFDSTNNKIIVAWRDHNNSFYAETAVGTISGTSISFGSTVVAASFNHQYSGIGFDSTSGKCVLAVRDAGNNIGWAFVGTVSGTSISWGSLVQFTSLSPVNIEVNDDVASGKIIIAYQNDSANPAVGTLNVGTVSGTSISFGDSFAFTSSSLGAAAFGAAYDSTNNQLVYVYGQGSGVGNFARTYSASSTNLTSENYIGMSRGVVDVTSQTESIGSASVFESADTTDYAVVFDSNSNKIVIAYMDRGNSNYGTAIVGTVSGTSISFGSPTVFKSAQCTPITAVFDSSNNKIVISYKASTTGLSIVGTVSGTSISFGSEVTFSSNCGNQLTSAFDSNSNKVVVAFKDDGNSEHGTAKVGTVSGTSISFGSAAVFEAAQSQNMSSTFDSSNNKVIVAYRTSVSKAVVGTVSGTSISFGTAVQYFNGITQSSAAFDSSNNKVVIGYTDGSSGASVVGTVSGTDISFGSEVTFESGGTSNVNVLFDTSINKIVVLYYDTGNSDNGTIAVGTVSGTSITFGTPTVFAAVDVKAVGAGFDSSNNKVVAAYRDGDNSDYGTSVVIQPGFTDITRAEVAGGGNASVDVIGSVSDNQIGLTAGQQYFVQTDGTISTTAGSPSVLAGTAISATELVVKT